mmetsp:Transcript_13464/g.35813  ORF Transcript_13464/g.35813 Transcript_13464/m.35813 type:complete len:161 (-) Transcript_13464:526-1008(-)
MPNTPVGPKARDPRAGTDARQQTATERQRTDRERRRQRERMTEPMTESEIETDEDELDYDSEDDYMDDFEEEDLEDLAQELEEVGIDIKDLTLEELKRIAPLSMLLPHMSLNQIKEALKKNVTSPDGRPIVRTTVQKQRPIPRNTTRFILDGRGNRIYMG